MALCVVNSRPDTESDLYRAYQDFASLHSVREPIDASGMSQVITYLAKEYEVNYHNHLELQKLRLLKIQWTHYCQRHGLDKPAKRFQDLVDLSQAKNYDSSKHDETTVEWVAALMMPVSLVVIHALNIVSRMLRLKTSTLVPLYSTDAKYLTLDTDALAQLSGIDIQDFRKDKEANWYKNFKFSEATKKCFDWQIKTDGVGCSVVLKTVTLRSIPPEKPESESDDPWPWPVWIGECNGNNKIRWPSKGRQF